jgi:hypothetical protein
MNTSVVLVLGNAQDPLDALPIRILPALRNAYPAFTFIPWDPTEELPPQVHGDIILIDTAVGIESITIFDSLDKFILSPHVTVHDFDLPVALGLLKKTGKIKNIKIIAIPPHFPIHLILRKCEAQLMQGS